MPRTRNVPKSRCIGATMSSGPQRAARADADRLMAALAEGATHATALLPEHDHSLVEGAA